jgi:uncharacterized membrane protein HdeD (DUF308 family)
VPKVAIGFGLALIILGVIGFVPHQAKTALIPAIPGALLLLLGIIGLNPGARKHAMHAAAGISLLGALAPIGGLIARGSQASPLALTVNVGMLVLCAAFLILCVRSFIEARKNRTTGSA